MKTQLISKSATPADGSITSTGCAAMGSEIAWMVVLLVLALAMRRVSQ